jgi:hypothetical protein
MEGKTMERTNNTRTTVKKASPPSALLIFSDGFNSLPIVVPNGGNEDLDERIMRWLERKLISRQGSKRAA